MGETHDRVNKEIQYGGSWIPLDRQTGAYAGCCLGEQALESRKNAVSSHSDFHMVGGTMIRAIALSALVMAGLTIPARIHCQAHAAVDTVVLRPALVIGEANSNGRRICNLVRKGSSMCATDCASRC
jgi:hypothetical protein